MLAKLRMIVVGAMESLNQLYDVVDVVGLLYQLCIVASPHLSNHFSKSA